ncbi:hypothetical protein ABZ553_14940 [Streptomyces sparsogenes]|uniref:hypothetical protein n=1 Tax=Streptomyces sparsogenes TaxID=67365 RepID=UPI0033D538C2
MTDTPQPTGRCFCGCGREVGYGRYFAQGHDKLAEAALIAARYSGSVAQLLHAHKFGPDNSVREAAVRDGGWENCPYCKYTGAPNSIRNHIGKDHTEKES